MADETDAALESWVDGEVRRLLRAEYSEADLAFCHIVVRALFDLDDDEAYEACEVGSFAPEGPDAYWHDVEGRRVHLVVARYEKEGGGEFAREDVQLLERALGWATSPKSRNRRDKLGSVAREIVELRRAEPDFPIEVHGAYFGTLRRAAKTELRRIEEDNSPPLRYEGLEKSRILAQIRANRSRDAPAMVEPVVLTLREYFTYDPEGQPRSIVANIDALELAKLERRFSYRLFQSNVRYLLRGRQRINDGMIATLGSDEGRSHFWYYNNGISILCDAFEWDGDPDENGNRKLRVMNLQVVNGCQTTATLSRVISDLEKADPGVRVLGRIIAGGRDEALQENIPLYNNRQNAVRDRDLQSNDAVQERLQEDFRQLSPPWFYERKRGEWDARGGKAALEPRYDARRISNDAAAQAYYAFFHDPGVARARKRQLFAPKKDGGLYEDIFNADTTAEGLLLPFRLAMQVHREVLHYRRVIRNVKPGQGSAAEQRKLDQEWLKFGEQYVIGAIGWYLRRGRTLTQTLSGELATDRFDTLVDVAVPRAVRDLTLVFRRVQLEQPRNEEGDRERVDYANYVKGHWSDVLELLALEYDELRVGVDPLESVFT